MRTAVAVLALLLPLAAAQAQGQPQPRRDPPRPATVTYRGECGGSWRDSMGKTDACARDKRPVCYSNGACQCEAETRCR